MKNFPFDLTQLDLRGLLMAMGIEVGPLVAYGDGTKFRSHCILPGEHTDEKDDDGAVGYGGYLARYPIFNCEHSCHKDTLGLKDILLTAGPTLVSNFAPAVETEDLPYIPGGHLRRSKNGIHFIPDDGESIHLCSNIQVLAQARDGVSQQWGLELTWPDDDGAVHKEFIPKRLLAGDAREVREILQDGGAYVTSSPKGRTIFSDYLNKARVSARARIVSKTGWSCGPYVLPEETIGDTSGEKVVYHGARLGGHAFKVSGTLEEWQEHVAQPCRGNSRPVLAVSAAFAAPLLNVLGMESGGVNFQGPSSTGKSTILYVGGSVCGGGGPKGFVGSWRSTSNGLEGTALAHNDAPLILDEMGEVDAAALGECAYMLGNGQGKTRSRADGSNREVKTWTVLVMSSGEISLADKMQEAGKRAKVGQEVRMVDIPADAGRGLGLFETLNGAHDGAAFADQLKQAALTYYGAPFRAFLTAVVNQQDRYRSFLEGQLASWVKAHCPASAGGQVVRVAHRFGLIAAAGELAIHLRILPWPDGEARLGVAACFRAWLEERGGVGAAEIERGTEQVLRFLQTFGGSRFEDPWNTNEPFRPSNRAGFRRKEAGICHYYMFPSVFKTEACKGFNARQVSRTLIERGLMEGEGGKTSKSIHVPTHGSQRVYHFPGLPEGMIPDEPAMGGGIDPLPDGDDQLF
jgi:uncharacterized protein (DUF927 family)